MMQNLKLLLTACVVFVIGCGGEDFSAPPPGLAKIRQKVQAENPADDAADEPSAAVATGAADVAAGGGDAEAGESSAPVPLPQETAGQSAEVPAAGTAEDATAAVMDADQPVAAAAAVKPSADKPSSPRDREASASVEGEVVTAGGKTDAQLQADKQNSDSVGKAGMSLLDKLKPSADAKKSPKASGKVIPRQVVTRTGRMAVAAATWFRLRNQLAKRFYVAATADGAKIAASSGERSIGVLSTQIDVTGEELSWTRKPRTVAAVVRERKEITTQPVTGLAGVVTSVELIQDGDVVLAGTEDGRLLARSCANLQDWDIYAQDLFAFQDEFRPATRIAESAVIAVRALNHEQVLTITAAGECHVWKTADVVHEPASPLEMTEQQARSHEAPLLTAAPLYSVALPASHVLGLSFSDSGQRGVVITSDEQVIVFDTDDGHVSDTISAAQLDDTQPVSVFIQEPQSQILVGLADGRILRRALTGATPVTGTDDEGQTVDYEVVFAPDTHDRAGAVTAMEADPDGGLLYFGRLNGFVTHFDLPRKQPHRSAKQHSGPVIEIRSTAAGVFTIGDDRVAKLSRTAEPAGRRDAREVFQLPKDGALRDKQLIEPEDPLTQDKFTVRRNFRQAATNAAQDENSLLGIRPADPVLALYEHQLRVNADEQERADIRSRIVSLQPDAVRNARRSASSEMPMKFAELTTEFDFQSQPLRRVVMSLSDDGTTLATAQYQKSGAVRGRGTDQPVIVWDTVTGTRLRTWQRVPGVRDLTLDVDSGMLLPQPPTARLSLFSGDLVADGRQSVVAQKCGQNNLLAVGLAGRDGAATSVLELWDVDAHQMQTSVEAFEGMVPAVAWSSDGETLFANVRDHSQSRLLELDGQTLQERAEIEVDPMDGQWNVESVDPTRAVLGPTYILPSPSGSQLVTYGRYADKSPYQLRIRRRSGSGWSRERMIVVDAKQAIVESEMCSAPLAFVDQQESRLAVVGSKGVGVISLRTGEVEETLEIQNAGSRRPVSLLSPDGKSLYVGDNDGNIWIASLRSLNRKPQKLAAHVGPVTGLAMSPNSRFLATAGGENRIQIWDMSAFPAGATAAVK